MEQWEEEERGCRGEGEEAERCRVEEREEELGHRAEGSLGQGSLAQEE